MAEGAHAWVRQYARWRSALVRTWRQRRQMRRTFAMSWCPSTALQEVGGGGVRESMQPVSPPPLTTESSAR